MGCELKECLVNKDGVDGVCRLIKFASLKKACSLGPGWSMVFVLVWYIWAHNNLSDMFIVYKSRVKSA